MMDMFRQYIPTRTNELSYGVLRSIPIGFMRRHIKHYQHRRRRRSDENLQVVRGLNLIVVRTRRHGQELNEHGLHGSRGRHGDYWGRRRVALVEVEDQRNDVIDELPRLRMPSAPHTADQVQAGIILDPTLSQGLLPLQLLAAVNQALLHDGDARGGLNFLMNRPDCVGGVGLKDDGVVGEHTDEELEAAKGAGVVREG